LKSLTEKENAPELWSSEFIDLDSEILESCPPAARVSLEIFIGICNIAL